MDHLSKTYLDRVFFSLAKLTPAPVPECKMQEQASPLLHFDLWLSSIFRALQIPFGRNSGCEIAGVQLRDAHQCDFELGGGVGIDTAVENAIGKA